MIKFFKATRPRRKRDSGRFILQVGKRMYHMSRKESFRLMEQLFRVAVHGR